MKEKREKTGKIRYDKYRFSVREWMRYHAVGSLIGLVGVWLVYHSRYALPLVGPVLLVYLFLKAVQCREKRRQTLQYHFRDFLSSLHTSLAAGYAMENAVRSATRDMEKLFGKEDILCRELREIGQQIAYQQPVEQLFRELGERSGVEDIRSFGEALMIAKRTGGNMDQVLESIWRNLCEKIDTTREIHAMVAAKRYEQKLMSLMPAGVILYLKLAFPDLLSQMYGNAMGVLLMTICLGIYLTAFFLGRSMTAKWSV